MDMFSISRSIARRLYTDGHISTSDYIIGPCLFNCYHTKNKINGIADTSEMYLHILSKGSYRLLIIYIIKIYDEQSIIKEMRYDFVEATSKPNCNIYSISDDPKILWQQDFYKSYSVFKWREFKNICLKRITTTSNMLLFLNYFEPPMFRCDAIVVNVGKFIHHNEYPTVLKGEMDGDIINDIENQTIHFSRYFNSYWRKREDIKYLEEDLYRLRHFKLDQAVWDYIEEDCCMKYCSCNDEKYLHHLFVKCICRKHIYDDIVDIVNDYYFTIRV
jgi:hypothetical protein